MSGVAGLPVAVAAAAAAATAAAHVLAAGQVFNPEVAARRMHDACVSALNLAAMQSMVVPRVANPSAAMSHEGPVLYDIVDVVLIVRFSTVETLLVTFF